MAEQPNLSVDTNAVRRRRCRVAFAVDTRVMKQQTTDGDLFADASRPPDGQSVVFVDRISSALSVHVGRIHGMPRRGGLAPWQERRVKALLDENLNERVPLSRLAQLCGLSVRHFARAFRQSAGVPPHRWLLNHRVARAKELLRDASLPLAHIALACGFADQSHFTRVFGAAAGVTPGAWRRMRLE